jgi:hypothetical protein
MQFFIDLQIIFALPANFNIVIEIIFAGQADFFGTASYLDAWYAPIMIKAKSRRDALLDISSFAQMVLTSATNSLASLSGSHAIES